MKRITILFGTLIIVLLTGGYLHAQFSVTVPSILPLEDTAVKPFFSGAGRRVKRYHLELKLYYYTAGIERLRFQGKKMNFSITPFEVRAMLKFSTCAAGSQCRQAKKLLRVVFLKSRGRTHREAMLKLRKEVERQLRLFSQ